MIHGVNVTKVEIEINNTKVWSKYYKDECNPIEITPFEYGIILVNLGRSEVKFHIHCDEIVYCHYVGLMLPSFERKQLCKNYTLPYLYYDQDSKKLYNKILYTDGLVKLCDDTDPYLLDLKIYIYDDIHSNQHPQTYNYIPTKDKEENKYDKEDQNDKKTSRSWWPF